MIYETKIRTRYAETDQMGIIYHANYFTWFEIGRTEFFRSLGMDYRELENRDVLLPVIDVGCKYKVSAKYDDEIVIKTRVTKLKGVKLQFEYDIVRREDGILLAEGYTIHAFVNKDLKPINFRKNHEDVWELLSKSME